jgi:hypothetical protein
MRNTQSLSGAVMVWYKERREKGLCVNCQEISATFRCPKCKAILNARINAMRAARRAAGLCSVCGCDECVCSRQAYKPKRPPKDKIAEEIAVAISGIDTRSDNGYWQLIFAINDVLDRYGLPKEKREKAASR